MPDSTPLTAADLLTEVEPLPSPQRCRRLADHARRARGRPELAAALDDLAGRGHYERSLAVFLASVAGDTGHILRAMRDTDPDVAALAAKCADRVAIPDDDLADLLTEAPTALRQLLYRLIRRTRRRALAEREIDNVARRWGDTEAAKLLPACGSETVAARVDDLAHAISQWTSLARRHPELVVDHAERVLDALPRPLRRTWHHLDHAAVWSAAKLVPHRVLALLERHWNDALPPRTAARLLAADPHRTLDLLLADPRHRAVLRRLLRNAAARHRLAALPDSRLAEVARAVRDSDTALANLLRAVAPARRAALFDAARAATGAAPDVADEDLLELLPAGHRVAEARRALALRSVAGDPDEVLEVTSHLPFEEAAPALREATRRRDADERAGGYRLLIACAGRARDPRVNTELLELLGRLRNEQDPVRAAALHALAEIPPSRWSAEHRPALARIVDDALAARDSSFRTASALTELAMRILQQGSQRDDADLVGFALDTIAELARHRGDVDLDDLPRVLRRGNEREVGRALAPHLTAEAGHGRFALAFTLADSLGRRGDDVPELQAALQRALEAANERTVADAVAHWLAPPATRGERVAALVERDPATVVLPTVFATLARHRTDLLESALVLEPPEGRFTGWRNDHLFYAGRATIARWTARQRERYVALLDRIVGDPERPARDRARAVDQLGAVPGTGVGALRPHRDSADGAVRAHALTALPWGAHPAEALAELLSHAESDDAHVAVYAAARCAHHTPPPRLAEFLEPLLAGRKVTTRKEAVRLLVRHRVPGASETLGRLWDVEDQHPHVRAAIASTARDLPDHTEAWRILREAVVAGREVAAPVLEAHPRTVPPRWRGHYADLVVEAAAGDDADVRYTAVEALGLWVGYATRGVSLLAELVADLDEDRCWQPAAVALARGARGGVGVDELCRAVTRLAGMPDDPDAQPERDRPAVQRLERIVDLLGGGVRNDRESALPVAERILDVVPAPLDAVLLAHGARWEDPVGSLEPLIRRLHGVLASGEVAEVLREPRWRPDPWDVLPHAEWLADQDGDPGGLLAVELVAEYAPRADWAESWRALLLRLRSHASPEVRHAATRVRTAPE